MKITLREALRDAIAEEMRLNKDVFILGEDIALYNGAYKVTKGLLEEFGEDRVKDTPISEIGITGMAVGASFMGLRPIVEFMTFNFSMQAIDHIINSAAKTHYMSGGEINCPIVFRGPNGAASRVGAQHSQCFASWFAHCPGLKVVAPSDVFSSKALLKAAIRDDNPVVFLENEILYGDVGEASDDINFTMEIGKSRIIMQGDDVTIVAFSSMVKLACEAAEKLKDKGVSCEVIDLMTLRPLDFDSIKKSIQKTNKLVVLEEGWGMAGIGSEIIAQAIENCFDDLDAQPVRVCAADTPLPYAENLENLALPSLDRIIDSILSII